MASDIPDRGWESSSAMARALATYIDCPYRIISIVRERFDRVPNVETIRQFRHEHLNPKPQPEALRIHPVDAYYPHEEGDRLAEISKRFLMCLQIERALSARANGNLLEAGRDAA